MQIDSPEKRDIVFYAPDFNVELGRVMLPPRVNFRGAREHQARPRGLGCCWLVSWAPPWARLALKAAGS